MSPSFKCYYSLLNDSCIYHKIHSDRLRTNFPFGEIWYYHDSYRTNGCSNGRCGLSSETDFCVASPYGEKEETHGQYGGANGLFLSTVNQMHLDDNFTNDMDTNDFNMTSTSENAARAKSAITRVREAAHIS